MVELQSFLNDLVTDSPHLGRARTAQPSIDNPGATRITTKRFLRVRRSRSQNHFVKAKDLALLEVVVVVAIVEVVTDLL
jgi:hypothetical protein